MVHHVLTSMNATTSMLVVIMPVVLTQKEASCAHVMLVSKVMLLLDALTLMNVLQLTVVKTPPVTTQLVHSHVIAMMVTVLVMVVLALISTNVLPMNAVTIKTASTCQDHLHVFVTLDLPPVQPLKVSLVSISMNAKLVTITVVTTPDAKTIQELSHVPVTLVSVVMVSNASISMSVKKMLHVTLLLPTVSTTMVHSLVNVLMVSKVQVSVKTALTSMNVLP
jgi:hypothetical protein